MKTTDKQIRQSKIDSFIELLHNFEYLDKHGCSSSKILTLPCLKKTRTVGIYLACFNCGIIAACREIFIFETLAQTANLFLDIINITKNFPKYIIYDIGCNFAKWTTNKSSDSFNGKRAKIMLKSVVLVDRFH